jgi:hypothetical protein
MAKNQPTLYPKLPRNKESRKRTRENAVFSSQTFTGPRVIRADRKYNPTGAYNPTYLSENVTVGYGYNIKSGSKNENFRVGIAKGSNMTLPYSREVYTIKPTVYGVGTVSPNWTSNGSGILSVGILRQENDVTALNASASARLKNRVQGKVGNAKLAAPIAESREIHRIVRQINNLTLNATKALLAIKKTKGKSALGFAADIWLGLGFGVNPMLKDIQSAADSVTKYLQRQDGCIVVSGTANAVYHSGLVAPPSSEYIAQDATISWHRSAVHTQGIRYVAGIDLTVRSAANYSVADHLGIELGELPSTLWELTPFSWVVDYGLTVGPWLDDMFYTVPGTVRYVSKNYRYQCVTTSSPIARYTDGTTGSFSGSANIARFTLFTRESLGLSLPVQPLRVKSMDEVASGGISKLLNLTSVLAGRHSPKL